MRTHRLRWHTPSSWSLTGPGIDTEKQPLINADTQDGGVKKRGKDKGRQKFSVSMPFRKQNGVWEKQAAHTPCAQNPFGDEHAINANANGVRGGGRGRGTTAAQDEEMEMEMEVDAHDVLLFPVSVPSTPSSTQGVFFPALAAALTRSASTPTTPKRSPHRRSSGSFKSFRSETSRMSARSPASSLFHKHKRRSQRLSGSAGRGAQVRSMRKTVQVLGPEAAGAVAMGTDVSPDSLRCAELERRWAKQLKGDEE